MSSDQLVFEEAASSESSSMPFHDRDYAYILDQNGGNYNGQIVFDTSPLCTSDRFANWSEAHIEIPLVMSLSTPAAGIAGFAAAEAQYSMALKNGFWQLIHGLSVEYNGKTLVQLTPYTNMYVGFKFLTSASQDDVAKWGPTLGFSKDSPLTYKYSALATPSIDGNLFCNNQNYVSAWAPTTATNKPTGNQGMLERQLRYCWDPTKAPWTTSTTAAICNSTCKNYHATYTGAGDVGSKLWYIVATLRLKDLANVFEQMPLVKGAQFKLTLNTNTSTTLITAGAGPVLSTTVGNLSILGGTNPIMITSATANNGSAALAAAAAGTWHANMSIGKVANSSLACNGTSHPTLQSCRLYVPLYSFNPEIAQQYISLGTKRKVVYHDIYQYQIVNTAAGSTFNQLISNGIVNPKRIIIMPFMTAGTGFSPFQSPFDTAPATTTPFISLTQLNVQVSGMNTWSMNGIYDYEQFLQELSDSGINGGKITGLGSGLINEADFQSSYRFYVCNIGRCLPNETGVPKSIQIMGTNASNLAIDLYCFVEYERTVTIDVVTGLISD